MMENNDLLYLIDVALGYAKDKALHEALDKVQAAQRAYLEQEAEAARQKSRGLINARVSVEVEIKKLKHTYQQVEPSLSREAKDSFMRMFDALDRKRNHLIAEKKRAANPKLQN